MIFGLFSFFLFVFSLFLHSKTASVFHNQFHWVRFDAPIKDLSFTTCGISHLAARVFALFFSIFIYRQIIIWFLSARHLQFCAHIKKKNNRDFYYKNSCRRWLRVEFFWKTMRTICTLFVFNIIQLKVSEWSKTDETHSSSFVRVCGSASGSGI